MKYLGYHIVLLSCVRRGRTNYPRGPSTETIQNDFSCNVLFPSNAFTTRSPFSPKKVFSLVKFRASLRICAKPEWLPCYSNSVSCMLDTSLREIASVSAISHPFMPLPPPYRWSNLTFTAKPIIAKFPTPAWYTHTHKVMSSPSEMRPPGSPKLSNS